MVFAQVSFFAQILKLSIAHPNVKDYRFMPVDKRQLQQARRHSSILCPFVSMREVTLIERPRRTAL